MSPEDAAKGGRRKAPATGGRRRRAAATDEPSASASAGAAGRTVRPARAETVAAPRPPSSAAAAGSPGGSRADRDGAPVRAAVPRPEPDETPGANRRPSGRSGFAPLARAAAPALATAGAKRGMAERRVLTEWPAVAGAALAGLCRPIRMVWRGRGEPGTLVVSADGPAALEAQHLADRIAERVNQVYGWRAVGRVRVVQSGASPAAPPRIPVGLAPVDAAADSSVSAIADDALRAALARLGANIRQRAARPDRSRA